MRIKGLALLLVAACGDDATVTKRDAALPRDTMEQPMADAPPLLTCTPRSGSTVGVRRIGAVSGAALLATSPPNDGRLFVLEQQGRIRIFENEQLRNEPFLDISDLPDFTVAYEQGLLGLAFHPNYAINRQFYVYYTTNDANVVARYFVSETDIHKADPAGEIVMSIPDFASNHNGGMIEFGPTDGYLYIGTGDGGHGGDPCRNGQQLLRSGNCVDSPPGTGTAREPLFGKILRIDVNSTSGAKNYAIPSDNPYANGVSGEPEIFIRGLRNPWRWSFDRMTGDMFIGDVGQGDWEEITALAPAAQKDANLGWALFEGAHNFYGGMMTGVTSPQFEKNQTDGWRSIIAGQTYRGTCFPDLVGKFFFTDHFSRQLHTATFTGGTFTATQLPAPGGNWPASPTSIHADARGELFMTTLSGEVFQIEAGP